MAKKKTTVKKSKRKRAPGAGRKPLSPEGPSRSIPLMMDPTTERELRAQADTEDRSFASFLRELIRLGWAQYQKGKRA